MISRTFLIKQNGNFANFWWGDGGGMMRVTKAKIRPKGERALGTRLTIGVGVFLHIFSLVYC